MHSQLPSTSIIAALPRVDYVVKNINAFELIGKFMVAARAAGWTEADLKAVIKEATSSHNLHLRSTLAQYCKKSGTD